MTSYVSRNPKIMGGAPVLKGTRIPVAVILHRLKDGNSLEEIHAMYPWVDKKVLTGAVEEAIQIISDTLHDKTILQA